MRVQGLWFEVWGFAFGFWGLWGLGFGAEGFGCRDQGFGFLYWREIFGVVGSLARFHVPTPPTRGRSKERWGGYEAARGSVLL